jgi:hypothetical protein
MTLVAYDSRGASRLDLTGVAVRAADVEGREIDGDALRRLTPVPVYLHFDAALVDRVLGPLGLRRAGAAAGG